MQREEKAGRESLVVGGRVVRVENMQRSIVARNVLSVAFLRTLSR